MTEREVYKGIEFVRISKLPKDQSAIIKTSFPKDKVFKILRDDEVMLEDCIQYRDYQDWHKKYFMPGSNGISIKNGSVQKSFLQVITK